MVTADDYASLLDPTNCCQRLIHKGRGDGAPGQTGTPVEGDTLAPCRRRGMPGWRPAEAREVGQIPSLPPLAVATTMRR